MGNRSGWQEGAIDFYRVRNVANLACNVAHDKNTDRILNNKCSGLYLIFWLRKEWAVYWRSRTANGIPVFAYLTLYFITSSFHLFFLSKTKLSGLSQRANYADRPTAACRRSHCQLFADRGCHVVSVTNPYARILGFLDRSFYFSIK
jgi:hypothetical protein